MAILRRSSSRVFFFVDEIADFAKARREKGPFLRLGSFAE